MNNKYSIWTSHAMRIIVPKSDEVKTMDGRLEEQPELQGTHTNCIFALSTGVFKTKSLNLVPLRVFMLTNNGWQEHLLPSSQKIIRIGSSPRETDILIENHGLAPVQIILRRIGKRWYVFDCGDTPLALFNGFRKRQTSLDPGGKIFIEINGIVLLFYATETEQPRAGDVQSVKNSFTLSFTSNNTEFPFAKPALIGRDEICDIKEGDHAFCALVFYEAPGGFYLYSPLGHTGRTANSPSENAMKLQNGSKFMAGNEKIIFNSEYYVRHLPGTPLIKDMLRVPLVLVELDDMDNIINKLVLPDRGRSVFLGRGPGNYFMIDGPTISKKHAQIMTGAVNMCVIDNTSTNGTYLNGERIEKKIAKMGDSIRFGDRLFILTCAE